MKTLLVTVLLSCSACAISTNPYAHTADEYLITYSKYELKTLAGIGDVYARIRKAAKKYCPSYAQIKSIREVQICISDIVDELVAKIDHPKMTAYHEKHGR